MPRTHETLRSALTATRMRSPATLAGASLEVCHENQKPTPRQRVLSRPRVNVERDSLLRRESRRGIASFAAPKSSLKSLVEMTYVPAARPVDFKNCCMISGEYDGSDRHYFFQGVGSSNNAFERPVTPYAQARVRRVCYFAPSARLGALRPAAQRER